VSRKSEAEARLKATEILRRASAKGETYGDEYGAGGLTRAQRKSQEKHIPLTPAPKTLRQKAARALWG
jgi:hypothetical protein